MEEDGKLLFVNTNYNALVIANKVTAKIEKLIPFEGVEPTAKNEHLRCVKKRNKI